MMQRARIRLCLVLGVLLLAVSPLEAQTTRYVRAGATGAGTGANWTDAYPNLPATLVRGDTYLIADGNYGSYNFNDPPSGTTRITIRKATVANHGTNTGWQDSYGDGQAVWSATTEPWLITTDYYTFDGAVGSGKSGYGFVVRINEDFNSVVIYVNGNRRGITMQYVDASAPGQAADGTVTCDNNNKQNPNCPFNNIIYAASGLSDSVIAHNYLHGSSWSATILSRSFTNVTIENNYFHNCYRKEVISDDNSSDVRVRYNTFENSAGTGIIVFRNTNNWRIYGNVFFTTNPSYDTTDCQICTLGGQGFSNSNMKIFNNTFVNVQNVASIFFSAGSNNEVRNNLFYGPNGMDFSGPMARTHNWCRDTGGTNDCSQTASETGGQIGSGNPFVNLAGGDFRLTAATNSGQTLGAEFLLDLLGTTRGVDGVWDRGAYEFGGVVSGAPRPPGNVRILP